MYQYLFFEEGKYLMKVSVWKNGKDKNLESKFEE